MAWISVDTGHAGGIRDALNHSGWLQEPVVAAGQLRQGKAPSMAAMLTGGALIEVLRPRRSKLLPRHFVLAVTPDRVVAFKAVGGSPENRSEYVLRIKPGEEASFSRAEVTLSDLPEGDQSKGGVMSIGGAQFPVSRPNLNGDPNTDELIALLGRL